MITRRFFAPSSLVIAGEAESLYGKPALACTVTSGVYVSITSSNKLHLSPEDESVYNAVKMYCVKRDIALHDEPFSLSLMVEKSELPFYHPRIPVLVAAVFHFLTGQVLSTSEVNNLSYQILKKSYPKLSGLENSASCLGGLIYYRKEFEFLKGIYQLPFKFAFAFQDEFSVAHFYNDRYLSVSDRYKELYRTNPRKAEKGLMEIEKTVKRLVVAIAKEDVKLFRDSLETIKNTYDKLGCVYVSTNTSLNDTEIFHPSYEGIRMLT
ncbi:hypothetical protein HGB07_08070 [Candidatus Roizmanbacteria bacterium]|nr:hypothetical protein [Candidatus Roizmanbacteria bacterium]